VFLKKTAKWGEDEENIVISLNNSLRVQEEGWMFEKKSGGEKRDPMRSENSFKDAPI